MSEESNFSTSTNLTTISNISENKYLNNKKQAVLKKIHPFFKTELHDKGYARLCQSGYQPTILSELELGEWTGRRFIDNSGNVGNYEVLEFTLPQVENIPSSKIFFGCDNPGRGAWYPYYKFNNTETENKYPIIPCCATKQKDTITENEAIQLKKNKGIESEEGKNVLLKNSGLIKPNARARLPAIITKLLRRINSDIEFDRYVNIAGPNSLIHAMLYITNDSYSSIPNKENLAITEKRNILKILSELDNHEEKNSKHGLKTFFSCKQELYDKDKKTILNEMKDDKTILDPELYYEFFEYYYNLNIYVFNENGFDIPKNKYCHIRSYNNSRDTVLLFKNKEPFQMSVIVGDNKKIFGSNTNKIIYDTLTNVYNNLVINSFGIFKNFLNKINYANLFTNIESQSIDKKSGKLIALNIIYKNSYITIAVPPSEPLNIKLTENFEKTSLQTAVEYMKKQPIAGTFFERRCNGVWFEVLDFKYSFYIPIKSEELKVNTGPPSPLFTAELNNDNELDNLVLYRKLERTMNLIFGLIKWSYMSMKAYLKFDLIKFSNLMIVKNIEYNISKIEYKLPENKNDQNSILSYISERTNGTLSNGKNLIIKSELLKYKILQKLKIFDISTQGMIYNISVNAEVIKNLSKYEYLDIPRKMEGYYKYSNDFKVNSDVLLFLNTTEYNTWMEIKLNGGNGLKIYTKLNAELSRLKIPYILRDEKENLYLIQNTKNLGKAIGISKYFKEKKNNLGYNGNDEEVKIENYILFGVENYKLGILENRGVDKNVSLVLRYDNGVYGAVMLI